MRLRVAIFGTLGVLMTALAAGFAYTPELLLSIQPVASITEQLADTDPKAAMLAATGIVGLYVALVSRASDSEQMLTAVSEAEQRYDRTKTTPPEAVTADRRTLTAADLDAEIDNAIESGGEPLRRVRSVLADTVTKTYAEENRINLEKGRGAVEAGTWTDDAVAAAFLGGENAPDPSLLPRIRLWLAPERERSRRIKRTVAELSALTEDDQ